MHSYSGGEGKEEGESDQPYSRLCGRAPCYRAAVEVAASGAQIIRRFEAIGAMLPCDLDEQADKLADDSSS